MKWIYDNYEFENRINNLSWTISGKYDVNINKIEQDYTSKDIALYFAIMTGARHKYIDWNIVKKYISSRINQGYDSYSISNIVQIALNKIVEEKIIEDRPGVNDIRNKAYKDILNGLSQIYQEDTIQKVKYALVLNSMGKHPSVDRLTKRIIDSINDIDIHQDTIDILKNIDYIYLQYFQDILNNEDKKDDSDIEYLNLESSDINFDTFSDFMYEELYDNENEESLNQEINDISSSLLIEGVGKGDISSQGNNRTIYVDEETLDKIYKKIQHYYGKSYLKEEEIKKIETKHSRGVHEGCRIHFTEGVLRSECKNVAQIKYTTRQKENNIAKFRENFRVYKRNITKLKQNLSRILIEESEITKVYSDCGNINANKVWRATRSESNKIFYKDIQNDNGKYVIDILLDSSGSQSRNQANVAIQAYIISQALTMVNIPNRVMGFSSFMDYTILKRFKGYEDKIDKTENIFEYFCAGNNRDGLAIKSACDELLDRKEENKILIVLSDGKPNDVKIGKDRERSIRGEMSYKGVTGIKDTANEVRRARKQGILVLGVFTGKESDLQHEKMIYGRDFIYTKDIDRFSEIVSIYLKKIIKN